jgi:hypothetical protein
MNAVRNATNPSLREDGSSAGSAGPGSAKGQ